MKTIFVSVLIILSSFFGYKVCSIPQKMADREKYVNITPAKSHDSTPPVIIRAYSILKGRCGCFDYSGQMIVYNPANICESILLCHMLHNIAVMQHLHFNTIGLFLPKFKAQFEFHDVKPNIGFLEKDQDTVNYVIRTPETINMTTSCLSKLLQKDVPSLLIKLQNLLCLFQQGKDEFNEALYKEFLKELNTALKDVGCSLDEVLNTKNILEQITDNAGKIADRIVYEILRIADDLGITGQLLNAVCKLLGKTLANLSDTLASVDLNVDLGLKNLVGGILG